MIFLQHGAQLRGDALRKENRHSSSDPEEFDVRNGPQTTEDFLQPRVAKKKGVATRQKHIADFRVLFEILEGGLKFRVQFLFANPTHNSTARAVAAVTCATIGYQEKDTIGIAMD